MSSLTASLTPVQVALCQRIGEPRYELWFHKKTNFTWQDGVLNFVVHNLMFQDYISKMFLPAITEAAAEVYGEGTRIRFVIDEGVFPIRRTLAETAENASEGTRPLEELLRREGVLPDLLRKRLLCDIPDLIGTQEAQQRLSPQDHQVLTTLNGMRALAASGKDVHEVLTALEVQARALQTAIGAVIEMVFNQFAGLVAGDDSPEIASRMDAIAKTFSLRFETTLEDGHKRPASLRASRAGSPRRMVYKHETYEKGKTTTPRGFEELPPTHLIPAPPDGRRRPKKSK